MNQHKQPRPKDTTMKNTRIVTRTAMVALLALLCACAPATKAKTTPTPTEASASQERPLEPGQLPVRFQQPSYVLKESASGSQLGLGETAEIKIPIGADISSTTGPVALRDILKRLAALKKMNISWASDVDQHAMVDVDIRAEDDFFESIDNLLRQVDYYHEVKGNTIVVKYRETRKFQVAMPFMVSTYNTGVGGDVLGAGGAAGTGSSSLVGNIQITSNDNKFDIWGNIQKNLDQLLEIWEETVPAAPPAAGQETTPAAGQKTPPQPTTRRNVKGGKGYYTIDKPIGLITVTAPRPLVEKIDTYLTNLKTELFRQISIEAKIVEVELNDTTTTGIDWAGVLSNKKINFQLFGPNGIIHSSEPNKGGSLLSEVSIPGNITVGGELVTVNPFSVLLDAIKTQGDTNILANPKISVLNGQPALINVGETYRYIKEVGTTITETTVTTDVETDTVMSGLGLSVLPTIMENGEIVLSLTPVTSQVTEIVQRDFGTVQVELPYISIREMNTIVRVKNGDTLMIGGLIDNKTSKDSSKVPLLGDIPGVGKLFSHDTDIKNRKELVILLQPKII